MSSETNGDLDEQISQLMQCKPLSEQQVWFLSLGFFIFMDDFGVFGALFGDLVGFSMGKFGSVWLPRNLGEMMRFRVGLVIAG